MRDNGLRPYGSRRLTAPVKRMPMTDECPGCRRRLVLPEDHGGRRACCPVCKAEFAADSVAPDVRPAGLTATPPQAPFPRQSAPPASPPRTADRPPSVRRRAGWGLALGLGFLGLFVLLALAVGIAAVWRLAPSAPPTPPGPSGASGPFSDAAIPKGETKPEPGEPLPHRTPVLTLRGHPSYVLSVCFSPDGKAIASGGGALYQPGEVILWDARTGKERRRLGGHARPVQCVAFSPDGTALAGAGSDGAVLVWDARTGRRRATLTGHKGTAHAVAYSPDGKTIASGGDDQTVRLWDAGTGEERSAIRGLTREVLSLAFSPDGKSLAGACGKVVVLWDAGTGEERATLNGGDLSVDCVAYSPDGKTIASCGQRTVRLWDAESQRERVALIHDRLPVPDHLTALAFSPDSQAVVSGSYLGTVTVWDARTDQRRAAFKEHARFISGLAFSPDGQTLAVACGDGSVTLWSGLGAGQEAGDAKAADAKLIAAVRAAVEKGIEPDKAEEVAGKRATLNTLRKEDRMLFEIVSIAEDQDRKPTFPKGDTPRCVAYWVRPVEGRNPKVVGVYWPKEGKARIFFGEVLPSG